MEVIRPIVEIASFALAAFALWLMMTPHIKTGALCTVGFGLIGLGFFGVGYVMLQDKDIVYRPMFFVVIGSLLVATSVLWNFHVKRLPVLRRVSDYVGLLSK